MNNFILLKRKKYIGKRSVGTRFAAESMSRLVLSFDQSSARDAAKQVNLTGGHVQRQRRSSKSHLYEHIPFRCVVSTRFFKSHIAH